MREIAQEWPGGAPPPHDPTSYVLVVDDESAVRDVLSRRLEAWGYDARKAGSAVEALEMMVQKPASLVLCDVRMPGQDGLWLADRLRAHWPHTPVVMATAVDDLQTVRQSRESGAIDYVTKPISVDRLREVVRRAALAANEGTMNEGIPPGSEVSGSSLEPQTEQGIQGVQIEAEYAMETPVRCPACGERIASLKAVRLIRASVNFTSTLPRRGRVLACPHCLAVVPAELTNF